MHALTWLHTVPTLASEDVKYLVQWMQRASFLESLK
jgi:hypothetical protein